MIEKAILSLFDDQPNMLDYLPKIGLDCAVRKGRNVYEGYQRGWGLEFGDLADKILQDPDYLDALGYAQGRTIVARDRLMNLFLLLKFYIPKLTEGHIIEYGAYRGGTAFFMAALAKRFLPGTEVFALDTFTGMPTTDKAVDAHSVGDFSDTSLDEVISARERFGLTNVHFVAGLFQNTARAVLERAGRIRLAHIDCDVYEAVKYAYEISKHHMVPMGYYVFDDSTTSSCIGATEAVEEVVVKRDGLLSEQISPHHVFRSPAPKNSYLQDSAIWLKTRFSSFVVATRR